MRKSKWTEEPIIGLLQEAEAGTPITEVCRRIGVSEEASTAGIRAPFERNIGTQ